jgi:hypothetical protein
MLAAIKEAKDRIVGNAARVPEYSDDMSADEMREAYRQAKLYDPAFRRSIRRSYCENFLNAHAPLLTRRFRRELADRAIGQLLEWHWALPRRHRWLGPVFEKTEIDRLAPRL